MTIYTFRVHLEPNPAVFFDPSEPVWRDIEVDDSHTLTTVHKAICEEFDRDSYRYYAFCPYDEDGIATRCYVTPMSYSGGENPSWPAVDRTEIAERIKAAGLADASEEVIRRCRDRLLQPPAAGNAAETTIADLAPQQLCMIRYRFNRTAEWDHRLVLKTVREGSMDTTPSVVGDQGYVPKISSSLLSSAEHEQETDQQTTTSNSDNNHSFPEDKGLIIPDANAKPETTTTADDQRTTTDREQPLTTDEEQTTTVTEEDVQSADTSIQSGDTSILSDDTDTNSESTDRNVWSMDENTQSMDENTQSMNENTQSMGESTIEETPAEGTVPQQVLNNITDEVGRVLVGLDDHIGALLISLLTKGNVLLEGVPGVAKTSLANAFARATGLEYARIQMTPDILPADITGTKIYREQTGTFELQRGPVFANVVVADEINRATPKTQSALLEAMAERQVSIEGETLELPEPFIVIATQNPIEMEGTFELPEAQRDRFQIKLAIDVPERAAEKNMLKQFHERPQLTTDDIEQVVTPRDLIRAREAVTDTYVADSIFEYVLDIVEATREHDDTDHGASPRASLALIHTAKAHATIAGREFVIPDDVKVIARPVLIHRLVLSTEAEIGDVDRQTIVQDVLNAVVPPGGNEDFSEPTS